MKPNFQRATSSSALKYVGAHMFRNNNSHDSMSSGSEESDTESDEESSVSSNDSGEIVDLKVRINQDSKELRGFSVSISKGFDLIMKQLELEYGCCPKLSYFDEDGDEVNILASSDFKYIVRSHKSQTSMEKKSRKLGMNKLYLIANFRMEKDQNIGLTISKSVDQFLSPVLIYSESQMSDICAATSSPQLSSNKQSCSEMLWQRGELLGSGSFGQVYSAIVMSSGIRIAVKEVILGSGKRHEEQALALLQEIRILSELDHPNIIKYLGTEHSDSHHTIRIFLELATEGSIKDALTSFGALGESIIRRYSFDIVSGLAFLHSKRFIHRDIKPTNLLIKNGVIKIADFGCSSSSYAMGEAASELGHYTTVGTTVYMAPECMGAEFESSSLTDNSNGPAGRRHTFTNVEQSYNDKGNSPLKSKHIPLKEKRKGYGRKVDIWSLGITLQEMSTAKSPYKTAAAAIFNICISKTYPKFSDTLSNDAHHFLGRCLVADPKMRANCDELMAHPFLLPQTTAELRSQVGKHTLSAISFEPIDKLPLRVFSIDKYVAESKEENLQLTTCSSTLESRYSKYSSVGSFDSWSGGDKENVVKGNKGMGSNRGRREGGIQEYKDIYQWKASIHSNYKSRSVSFNEGESCFRGLIDNDGDYDSKLTSDEFKDRK